MSTLNTRVSTVDTPVQRVRGFLREQALACHLLSRPAMMRIGMKWVRLGALGGGVLWGVLGCADKGPSETTATSSAALSTPPPALESFAVYAKNSVALRDRAKVTGGGVGVKLAGAGPFLEPSFELALLNGAQIDATRAAIGDSLELTNHSSVGDAITAHLTSTGSSTVVRQLDFPAAMPSVPAPAAVSAGTTSLTVNAGSTTIISAGKRSAVTVNGTLRLGAGGYDFSSLSLGNDARVEALGAVVVRISGRLTGLDRSHIVAASGTTLLASDIRLEVSGSNGGAGTPAATPAAAGIGNDAELKGLLLAPNGTIQIGQRTSVTGALAARDVNLNIDARVTFQSGFQGTACPSSCDDGNPCKVDVCVDGACTHTPVAAGTSCSDGNACNGTETCNASGACAAGTPVVCSAADACHVGGTCNPSTGTCSSSSPRPDGTQCSDGSACTTGEACHGGVCGAPTSTVVCSASDQCHDTGVCNAGTGVCSNPLKSDPSCAQWSDCADPNNCLAASNVPDPTPTLEPGCTRLRDIPVRFVDYRQPGDVATYGSSNLNDPAYIQGVLTELNQTFAKTCMTFHERGTGPGGIIGGNNKFDLTGIPAFNPDGTPVLDSDTLQHYDPNFDWADPTDAATWPQAAPFYPDCPFHVPTTGIGRSFDVLRYILNVCEVPDELTVAFISQDRGCCFSEYQPDRFLYVTAGALYAHEVGHNFGLLHSFELGGPGPMGGPVLPVLGTLNGTPELPEDYWDLVYANGGSSPDQFFKTRAEAAAARTSGKDIKQVDALSFGVYLAGTYQGLSYKLPKKVSSGPGDVACDAPADGGPACSARDSATLDNFCYVCEYQRMYDSFYGGSRTFPPPPAPPSGRGLLYAPGQSFGDWRDNDRAGTVPAFRTGFLGFVTETLNPTLPYPPLTVPDPIRALAPSFTKLQIARDPERRAIQLMGYGLGHFNSNAGGQIFQNASGSYVNVGDGRDTAGWYAAFPALSSSQVDIVNRTFTGDVQAGTDPSDPNPHRFGHRPAYGSWEKLGEDFDPTSPPSVVASGNGAFITAKSDTGDVVYRRWQYADSPWIASSTSGWQTVLPATPRSVSGFLSSAYVPAAPATNSGLHILIRQVSGSTDEIENAAIIGSNGFMRGWDSVPAAVRGSPIAVSGVEKAPLPTLTPVRLTTVVLGRSGTPASDQYYFNDWTAATNSWFGWEALPAIAGVRDDAFDATERPGQRIATVAVTADGHAHSIVIEADGSVTGWDDLGAESGAPPGPRPSVSSMMNGTGKLEEDVVVTNSFGSVSIKTWKNNAAGVSPADTSGSWSDWIALGGVGYARSVVTSGHNTDLDIVAREPSSNTVRYKRRRFSGDWAPGQQEWFNLGGEAASDPVAVPREGLPDVVDVFAVGPDHSLWHRAYVVPAHESDPDAERYEISINSYCCALATSQQSSCPCSP